MATKTRFKQKEFKEAVHAKRYLVPKDGYRLEGLRKLADTIGISPATLSRVLNGKTPDLETFFQLCFWMRKSPLDFFDYK